MFIYILHFYPKSFLPFLISHCAFIPALHRTVWSLNTTDSSCCIPSLLLQPRPLGFPTWEHPANEIWEASSPSRSLGTPASLVPTCSCSFLLLVAAVVIADKHGRKDLSKNGAFGSVITQIWFKEPETAEKFVSTEHSTVPNVVSWSCFSFTVTVNWPLPGMEWLSGLSSTLRQTITWGILTDHRPSGHALVDFF